MITMRYAILLMLVVSAGLSFSTPFFPITGCMNISGSGVYQLQNNLVGANISAFPYSPDMACIRISTSNVSLDCNGWSITNNGTGRFGIITEGNLGQPLMNLTLQNCHSVSGYNSNGVLLYRTNYSTLTNMTLTDNGNGVDLQRSHSNNVTIINSSSNTNSGVQFEANSSGNILSDSFAQDNGLIDVISSPDSLIDCSNLVVNVTGSGGRPVLFSNQTVDFENSSASEIELCGSSGSIVKNMSIAGSGSLYNDGVVLMFANKTLVSGSTSSGNAFGFADWYGLGNTFSNDVADNNTGIVDQKGEIIFGAFELLNCTNDLFANDSTENDQGIGYVLLQSNLNTLMNDSANNTNLANNLVNITISQGLNFTEVPPGAFFISSSKNNLLEGDLANNDPNLGFNLFYGTSGNTLDRDTSSNNGLVGFFSMLSLGNILSNDISYGNNPNNLQPIGDKVPIPAGGYGFLTAPASMENDTAYGNLPAGVSDFELNPGEILNSGGNTSAFFPEVQSTILSDSHLYGNPWAVISATDISLPTRTVSTIFGNTSIRATVFEDQILVVGQKYNDTKATPVIFQLNDSPDPSGGVPPAGLASFHSAYLKIYPNLALGNLTGPDSVANMTTTMLSFEWNDSDLLGFDESTIAIFAWNGSSWTKAPNQLILPAQHKVSAFNMINQTQDDVYGVFAAPGSTPSLCPGIQSSGGGITVLGVSVDLNTNCFQSVLKVKNQNGGSDSGVPVSVETNNGSYRGITDINGEFTFSGASSMQCAQTCQNQTVECKSDSDCSGGQKCERSICVPVPSCQPQCTSDSQCPSGQRCRDSVCSPAPTSNQTTGCTSDSSCAPDQYCQSTAQGGACEPVPASGCGAVADHRFVPYECGDNCPACPNGGLCVDNTCISEDASCPSTVVVGGAVNCTATADGQSCQDCAYSVTDASGHVIGGMTGPDGSIPIHVSNSGVITVKLLKNGTAIKTININAIEASPSAQQSQSASAGPDAGTYLWVVALLAVVVVAIFYLRGRPRP